MLVVFVGLDDEFVCKFAKDLAGKLQIDCKDFKNEFNAYITMQKSKTLQDENELFLSNEKVLIKKLLKADNLIISIPNDVFISSENYKLFKNTLTILIEKKENEQILKNIQKLIKKHCKIIIKQEKVEIRKILNIVKG